MVKGNFDGLVALRIGSFVGIRHRDSDRYWSADWADRIYLKSVYRSEQKDKWMTEVTAGPEAGKQVL